MPSFDTDEVFRCIGEFGPWQQNFSFKVLLYWAIAAWQTLNPTFATAKPTWECTPKGLQHGCVDVEHLTDNTRVSNICQLEASDFAFVHGERTVVAEFRLICGDAWKVPFVSSAYFLGFLVGSGYFGGLADTKGRKFVFETLVILTCACAFLSASATTYWTYIVARIFTGFIVGGNGTVTFVYSSEFIGPALRAKVAMLNMVFFALGFMLLAPLAYFLPNWRVLTFVSSLPAGLLYFIVRSLPESPRWLLSQGREKEALAVLATIAKGNSSIMPPQKKVGSESSPAKDVSSLESQQRPAKVTVMRMLTTPKFNVYVAVQLLLWCVCSFGYYGLSLGAGSLSSNLYLNVVLIGAVEMPGYAVAALVLNRVGGRLFTCFSLLAAGFFCIGSSICPDGGTLSIHLSLLGKLFVATAFAVIFPFSGELFPTDCRSLGMGLCSQAARIGGIFAPQVPHLFSSWKAVVGLSCLVAGAAGFVLPDTRYEHMPETFDKFVLQRKNKSRPETAPKTAIAPTEEKEVARDVDVEVQAPL